MNRSVLPGASVPAAAVEWRRPALTLLALVLGTAAVLVGARGGSPLHALLVALLAGAASFALSHGTRATDPARRDALLLAAMAGLLAWAVEPGMRVWQAPPTWAESLAFSPVGGGLALALLLGGHLASALVRGRALGWREATALFLLPFLFTSLFLLSAAHLLADIGRYVGVGRWFGWYGEATFGRIVLLFLFNEVAIIGGGWLMDGHWTRSWRLRALLLLSAICASLTPQIASFGSGAAVAELPRLVLVVVLPLVAAAAMAGMWAQTFLLTGLMLDAIHGRRPAVEASIRHWREGAVKGAIYSFVFMLLVQLTGLLQTPVLWPIVSALPALTAVVAGSLLYPLGRTIIESFDGSAPFLPPAAHQCGRADGLSARLCGRLRSRPRDPARPADARRAVPVPPRSRRRVPGLRGRRPRAGPARGARRRAAVPTGVAALCPGRVPGRHHRRSRRLVSRRAAGDGNRGQARGLRHGPCPGTGLHRLPVIQQIWGAQPWPRRGRRAPALQRIALGRDQLVARRPPVQHQPGLPHRTPAAEHRPDSHAVQRPGRRRPGRAGDPRAALGPVDGPGHLLVPAHGARPHLVRPGRRRAHRRRHPQGLDAVAGGVPRLEPAGVPGPARLRLVPRPDLVRPYGPARRDPGQPVLRRWRPRRREGRPLDRPFRSGALRARRPAPVRDLGALADPVLHPARRRVGPGLGRGRAHAGIGTQPAAAGRGRSDGLRRLHRCGRAGGRLRTLARSCRRTARARLASCGALVARPPSDHRQRQLHARAHRRRPQLRPQPPRRRPAARARPHPPLRRPAAARRQVRLPARVRRRRRLVVARLAAHAPRRRHLRGRAARAAQPAARQRPRRRARGSHGRDHARGDRGGLAAAAHQRRRPSTHAGAGDLPGAGDRTLGLLPPDAGLQRAARRHLLRPARWVRSSPATATSSRARVPHGGYPFAREVAFHAAGGAEGSAVALTGYQDVRPCFIGTGTLAAPDGLASGRMRDPADEGLLYSFDPIASLRLGSSCRRAAPPSCASSTAMPPTRRWPPPRSPDICTSRRQTPPSWPPSSTGHGSSTAVCDGPATMPCPTASRPTAKSWSSPARPRAPGTTSWPTRWVMVRSPRTTARSSPSPATPSRTRSPPATWTRCRSRSRPAPSTSSTSRSGRIDSAGYTPQRRTDADPRDGLRPRLRHLHHAA